MDTHFRKSVIRMPFETVLDQLKSELFKEGFEIAGLMDLHEVARTSGVVSSRKYKVMSVYNPFMYRQMMTLSPPEGAVLPCVISVIETFPGETTLVRYNCMEPVSQETQYRSLENLVAEVTKRLDLSILPLERETSQPDLVTSWS